jgi:hypothetical protein
MDPVQETASRSLSSPSRWLLIDSASSSVADLSAMYILLNICSLKMLIARRKTRRNGRFVDFSIAVHLLLLVRGRVVPITIHQFMLITDGRSVVFKAFRAKPLPLVPRCNYLLWILTP